MSTSATHDHTNKFLASLVYQKLIMAAFQRKEYDSALDAYRYLFSADMDSRADPVYMTQWAIIADKAGKPLEALQELSKVEALNSNHGRYAQSVGGSRREARYSRRSRTTLTRSSNTG